MQRIAGADTGDVHAFLQNLTESPHRMYGIRQPAPDIAVLLTAGPGAGLFGARSAAAGGRVVGLAGWWRSDAEETSAAVAALVLAPTAHRSVVAERLLSAVVEDATAAGVRRFEVGMEPGNSELRSVARRLGLPETRRLDAGEVVVELALTAPDAVAPADDPVPG